RAQLSLRWWIRSARSRYRYRLVRSWWSLASVCAVLAPPARRVEPRAWPYCGGWQRRLIPLIVLDKPRRKNTITGSYSLGGNDARVDAGLAAALPQDHRQCGAAARQSRDCHPLDRRSDRTDQLHEYSRPRAQAGA